MASAIDLERHEDLVAGLWLRLNGRQRQVDGLLDSRATTMKMIQHAELHHGATLRLVLARGNGLNRSPSTTPLTIEVAANAPKHRDRRPARIVRSPPIERVNAL